MKKLKFLCQRPKIEDISNWKGKTEQSRADGNDPEKKKKRKSQMEEIRQGETRHTIGCYIRPTFL